MKAQSNAGDSERRSEGRDFLWLGTSFLLLVTFSACVVQVGRRASWGGHDGPLLPALAASALDARRMVTPTVWKVAAWEEGGTIQSVDDLDPRFDEVVSGRLRNGDPVQLVKAVPRIRDRGVWGPSYRRCELFVYSQADYVQYGEGLLVFHTLSNGLDEVAIARLHPNAASFAQKGFRVLPSVLIDAAGFFLLYVFMAQLIVTIRFRRRRPRCGCPSCGYSLAGLTTPVCPECGDGVAP